MNIYSDKKLNYFIEHLNIKYKDFKNQSNYYNEDKILLHCKYKHLKEIYNFLHLNKFESTFSVKKKEIIINNTKNLLTKLNSSFTETSKFNDDTKNYLTILTKLYRITDSLAYHLIYNPEIIINFTSNDKITKITITKNSKNFIILFCNTDFFDTSNAINKKLSKFSNYDNCHSLLTGFLKDDESKIINEYKSFYNEF